MPQQLSAEALIGVIDEFIHREGTEYGHQSYTLEEKRQAVMALLSDGSAVISYDSLSESTSIVNAEELE